MRASSCRTFSRAAEASSPVAGEGDSPPRRLTPSRPTDANTIGCTPAAEPRASTLDNILFPYRALHGDHTFRFELTHDRDDLLLRRLHFFDADRTQRFHLFLQHVGPARGHGSEEMVTKLLAGAFERERQHLAIDFADNILELDGVDHQKVFEDEHEVANRLDQVRIVRFYRCEDFLARARIQTIEHLRHRANSAIGFAAVFPERLQLLSDHRRDLV